MPMLPVTIHHLVPEFILQQFRAGVRQGSFTGVGMFVDISGFSGMTDSLMVHGQHGAEVLATVMRAVFIPLIQTVHEHEGFIATLAGDAFTALFPFERMADTGPVCADAVQAAWEIQQQMAANAVHATPYGTYHVSAKMGIAVGEARWGIITSEVEQRAAYYFRGSAVEECAEVEHVAQAGEIILDATVCKNAPAHAKVEPRGSYFHLTSFGDAEDPDTGNLLEWGTMALPAGPGEMVRFFPESLVTQEHTGEFRQVVNLFIQMPTIRTEDELEAFMRALFSLQDQYGGLLNRVDFGDKGAHLLMFWGAPVSYRNDIGRALNFVLKLQTLTSLPFTAGLTYRISHAGFIGSPLREEFTCYGRGVNLAARFMTAAPRGDVWVDEEIFQRVADYFELEPLGAKPFKGFSEPQNVYRLLERKEQTESSFQGAFIGRKEELARLEAFIQPVAKGQFAGAMIISGEAGIGKSRLVSAFQMSEFMKNMKPMWAFCQNDQILQEALNPFRYWLRQYCMQSSLASERENKQNFTRKLDELVSGINDPVLVKELERTRSFLGALLDLHWPDSLYEQLEGPARFENTLIGLAILFQAESLRQPVIILIEDAQWLDVDSRTFIPRFVRTLTASESTYRIGLLATFRPERSQKMQVEILGTGVAYEELKISGFGLDDLERLAETLLSAPANEALINLLGTRAEGNPFFAEQILRYLKENGDLQTLENGQIGVRQVLLESAKPFLPTDVQVLLVARLDQLTRELRDIVQAASVLGQEFEARVLMGMLRNEEQVVDRIKNVEEEAIWSAINQLRYLFRHALLRDAAYRMQVHTRRERLHRMAVEALELLYFENLAPHYGELGYHAEQARLNDKARDYLHKAGDAAKDAYQHSEAVDYYTRALALTPEKDFITRFEILFAREQIYQRWGDREMQAQELAVLENLATRLNDPRRQIQVALSQALLAGDRGEYNQNILYAQKAVTLAEQIGEDEMRATGYLRWGTALYWQGDYEMAETYAQQARVLFQALENSLGEGDALFNLGETMYGRKKYELAQRYFLHALETYQNVKKYHREAKTLNYLGLIAGNMKEYRIAREYYEKTLDLYRQTGHRQGEGVALNNLGTIFHMLGNYEQARDYYQQSLPISRQIGSQQEEAITLNNLGEILTKQKLFLQATEYYEQSLKLARAIGFRYAEAHTLYYYGETLLALNQLEDSKVAFQRTLSLRQDLGLNEAILSPKLGLVHIAQKQGKVEKVFHALNEILSLFDSPLMDHLEDSFGFYWTCFKLLNENQDSRAKDILEKAYHQLKEQAATIPEDSSRHSFLYNVPEHRNIIETFETT